MTEPLEITLRPTGKVVEIVLDEGTRTRARVWQGHTKTGTPLHCYILRVAVDHRRPEHELAQFERELKACEPMREDVQAIPLRLIL